MSGVGGMVSFYVHYFTRVAVLRSNMPDQRHVSFKTYIQCC